MQLGIALHAVSVHARLSGRPERGARISGAAQVLAPRWPLFERRYGELLASAPVASTDLSSGEVVGAEILSAEMAAGSNLSLEEVLAITHEQLSQASVN
jgi:hypothetical protein